MPELIALQNTLLKARAVQSSQLPDSDVVAVKKGQKIYATSIDTHYSNHYGLELTLGGFKRLYAFQPHWELEQPFVPFVRFFPQTDNKWLNSNFTPDNTCNSSSCAMYGNYFLGDHVIPSDDFYINQVLQYGLSTDHEAQTKALKSLGVNSVFLYDATWADLKAELKKGHPSVVGFYHRGSRQNPTGGHVACVLAVSDHDITVNDPYGSLLDGYTSDVYNGERVTYPRAEFEPRWLPEGPRSGFMRILKSLDRFEKPKHTDRQRSGSEVLKLALDFAFRWEGGYVDHQDDLGGPTNRGITQATYSKWLRDNNQPDDSVKNCTLETATKIYSSSYWVLKTETGWLNDALEVAIIDTAINFGVSGCAIFLEELVGETQFNGVIRPALLEKLKSWNSLDGALQLCENRKRYRKQRVDENPSQKVFYAGWINRDNDLKKYLKTL